MTTVPSPEYVSRQFQLADEALNDAGYLLDGSRFKAAANRAYYAMFHAAMAALATANVTLPKTHAGTLSQFSRHFVREGRVDRRFSRDFQQASHLRVQSDYEAFTEVEEVVVNDVVAKAEAFVAEVRRVVEGPALGGGG